jgi:hypothetical protein
MVLYSAVLLFFLASTSQSSNATHSQGVRRTSCSVHCRKPSYNLSSNGMPLASQKAADSDNMLCSCDSSTIGLPCMATKHAAQVQCLSSSIAAEEVRRAESPATTVVDAVLTAGRHTGHVWHAKPLARLAAVSMTICKHLAAIVIHPQLGIPYG